MNINDLRIDDLICVRFHSSCNVVQVTSIENNSISVRTKTNDSFLIGTQDEWEQIEDILLSEVLLAILDFFKHEDGTIYGLVGQIIYEKCYTRNGVSFSINLINERGIFSWVTKDADAYFGCRTIPVRSLRELQHLFYDTYGVKMPINLF